MAATVLIVDGPRAAGKTTIVKQVYNIVKESGRDVRIHKTGRPAHDLWDGVEKTITDWVFEPASSIVIVDRFHLTELVYSTALGRTDDTYLWQRSKQVDYRLLTYSGPLRYTVLIAHIVELYNRPLNRPEGPSREIDIPPDLALLLWTTAVAKSPVATLRMNSTQEQSKRCVDDMAKWLKTWRMKT